MSDTMAPAGRRSLWTPLRTRSFLSLWLAQSFSLLGDGCSYVAFSWITLSLSRSSLALGVVLACQAVPRALLTLVGGAVSDRISPRLLMIGSSVLRCVLMLAVAAVGFGHVLSLWMLMAAAALFGAVDAFFQPARGSILPSAVPADQLEPANALLNAGSRVALVLGPALGGVIVAASDANAAFLVDGCCFALVAAFVGRVPGRRTAEAADPTGPQEPPEAAADPADPLRVRIRTGLRYVWADPRIRAMLAIDAAVTFCYAGPFTVGFASLAKFRLDGGATSLGLLNAALAGGAIIGSLLGGATGVRLRVGLLIAALTGWLAVGMFVLGISTDLLVAAGAVLLMGIGIGFQGVFGISWIQRNIDADVLGRVIAVDMVAGYLVAPVSLVLCGGLAQARPGLMFFGTAVILALTGAAVVCSRPVVTMV